MLLNAHPQLCKVFKCLIYVCHGCGTQFERFYGHNNHIRVASIYGVMSVVVTVWVCCHMPIRINWRCLHIYYMYDMDVECSLKGSSASIIAYVHGHSTYIAYDFSQFSQICVVVTVWVCCHMPMQKKWIKLQQTIEGDQTPYILWMPCMWDAVWKVLQPQPQRSGMITTLTSLLTSANSTKYGEMYVVVTRCNCAAICPSISIEGVYTPYICMPWMWNAFWKALHSLNHSVLVAWSFMISTTLPNLEMKRLWW